MYVLYSRLAQIRNTVGYNEFCPKTQRDCGQLFLSQDSIPLDAYEIHTYEILAYEMHADETHISNTLAYVDPEGIKVHRKRSNRTIYSLMKTLEVLRAAGNTSELLILQHVESSGSSEASISGKASINDEASNAGEDDNSEAGIGEVVFH